MSYSYRFCLLAALLLAAASASATRRLVPQQYPTIQAALQAAQPHDTILVSPGTYFENLRYGGKNVTVASTFLLNRLDPTLITRTVIDGSRPARPDTASVVRFIDGEDSTAVLFGFTLTGGTGTEWRDPHSPGVFREGGAILAENASPTIQFNYIVGNQATATRPGIVSAGGGGIRVDGGRPRILNNVIAENQGRYGAGVVINYSGAILRNNVIGGNRGGQDFGGGGVWINGTTADPVVLENNTIVGNASTGAGGGVHIFSPLGTRVLRNNIVWANTATTAAQISNPAPLQLSYNDVEGVVLAGPGNRSQYPVFDDSAAWLLPTSPAVDAGDPAGQYHDPATGINPQRADFPAHATPHNDMGAYGGPGSAPLAPFRLPGVLSGPTSYRFNAQLVGTVVPGRLAITNQGTRPLVVDSVTVRPGGRLALTGPVSFTLLPFYTDTVRFTWRVAATGAFADTLRLYHRDPSQPNPRLVRVQGTGRPNGLPDDAAITGLALWPNPVSGQQGTTLRYRLLKPAHATLTLSDALGRQVHQQTFGPQPAGEYEQPIPAATLRPGLYVARLSSLDTAGHLTERTVRLIISGAAPAE